MAAPSAAVQWRVSVSDPQKIGEGMQAYVSYKVSSQLSDKVAGLDSQVYSVIRRFNDFVWLRGQLRDVLPYLIVPALPEKQQIGRFNDDFVAVRHRALQRWVDRVSTHPEVTATDIFRKFVSFPAESLAALREGSRGDMVKGVAEEGKKTLLKMFKSASIAAQGALAQARGGPAPSAATAGASFSTEDLSFADLEVYLVGQAPLLTALYNEAAAVAVRAREQAQLLLDFGASLRALGQSEGGTAQGGPASFGTALMAVGLASWASSTAAYEQAVCETELCVEKLADYVRGTRAVKECLDSRARASAELRDTTAELERLRALGVALASAPPTPTSGKDKAQNEVDLAQAQMAATAARAFYDRSAAGVISEVERMRVGMCADFRAMLLDFVSIQVRTEHKLAQAWERIREEVARCAAAEGAAPLPIAAGAAAALGAAGGAEGSFASAAY